MCVEQGSNESGSRVSVPTPARATRAALRGMTVHSHAMVDLAKQVKAMTTTGYGADLLPHVGLHAARLVDRAQRAVHPTRAARAIVVAVGSTFLRKLWRHAGS